MDKEYVRRNFKKLASKSVVFTSLRALIFGIMPLIFLCFINIKILPIALALLALYLYIIIKGIKLNNLLKSCSACEICGKSLIGADGNLYYDKKDEKVICKGCSMNANN